jgi:hypothetical protein
MLASEKLAIAAHLHVLLRRKTGRVTDVEWMAGNATYAAEIVRFSCVKATEHGQPELREWALKLQQAFTQDAPKVTKPLVTVAAAFAAQALQSRAASKPALTAESAVVAAQATSAAKPASPAGPSSRFLHSGFLDSAFLHSSFGLTRPQDADNSTEPRYVGGLR